MKILIGLSGGLDSTFAAYSLKEAGHDLVGASVIMHEFTDISSAEEAARSVGIPFVRIDCRDIFKSLVVDKFVSEYCLGRTPNPCIECNPYVKFGALCKYADENGFDRVATGHYSSVAFENGRYFIRRAEDEVKDQSYVLWKLSQKQLSLMYLPLSLTPKSEIRKRARELGFKSADAKESQEICFIPDDDYVSYIEDETGKVFENGNFIDADGNILGRHKGIIRYTIGQRKGLGIALGKPMFVSKLDIEANTVTLVPSGREFFSSMDVEELNFMKLAPVTDGELASSVRVRYSSKASPCRVIFENERAKIFFDSPVRAVTSGQSAVFYDGNDLLFGGKIIKAYQ